MAPPSDPPPTPAARPEPAGGPAAVVLDAPSGGGRFSIGGLSLGVFLVDQPRHALAVGGDRPRPAPLAAGEGFLLPPGAEGVCLLGAAHRYLFVELPAPLLREAGLERPEAVAPRIGPHDPLTAEMARALAAAPAAAPRLWRDSLTYALAAQLALTLAAAAPGAAAVEDRRLRRALDRIAADLAADHALDALAAEAGMSPFHFARAFKRATGRSPHQHLIHERIEAAKAMLRATRLPVAEIAWRVGYGDVSRFAAHFKRAVGVTPAAFRAS
jgi:AraC family transcriptional regulator